MFSNIALKFLSFILKVLPKTVEPVHKWHKAITVCKAFRKQEPNTQSTNYLWDILEKSQNSVLEAVVQFAANFF